MRAWGIHSLWALLASSAAANPAPSSVLVPQAIQSLHVDSGPSLVIWQPQPTGEAKVTRDLVKTADGVDWTWSDNNVNLFTIPIGDDLDFAVDCVECTAGFSIHSGKITDANGDNLHKVWMDNASASFEFRFSLEGSSTASYTLWQSGIGAASTDSASEIGLVFKLELVVDVDADLAITGGFVVSIPDGAYFTFNDAGAIKDLSFGGVAVQEIPFHVESGSGTQLTASLRLSAELGALYDGDEIQIGDKVVAYVNLPEVTVDLQNTDTCSIEASLAWSINGGAYNEGEFSIGEKTEEEKMEAEASAYETPFVTLDVFDGTLGPYCLFSQTTTAPAVAAFATSLVGEAEFVSLTSSSAPSPPTTIVAVGAAEFVSLTSNQAAPTPTTTVVALLPPTHFNMSSTTAAPVSVGGGDMAPPSILTLQRKQKSAHGVAGIYTNSTITAGPAMHTSTVMSTRVYTVTSCAADVINCPVRWRQTVVVTHVKDLYTTVCPVTETAALAPATTTKKSEPYTKITFTKGITLTSLSKPKTVTFTAPAGKKPPSVHTSTVTVHKTYTPAAIEAKSTSAPVVGAHEDLGASKAEGKTVGQNNVATVAATTAAGAAGQTYSTAATPAATPAAAAAASPGARVATILTGVAAVFAACLLAM